MRESLHSRVLSVQALPIATRTANTAVNGTTVDLNVGRQNFRAAMFVILVGTVTDGSHAVTVQDSPDGSTWSPAASHEISGTLPTFTDETVAGPVDIGYVGDQRYVRIVVTTTGATSGATIGAACVLGQPTSTPVVRS